MNPTVRSAAESGLPQPGEIVAGKYRIDGVIGTGGMGVVMGALDTSLGRPVAVKFLSPAKARREGAVQRFVREARLAASIQSEHVVRVFEVGTMPAGTPYIVMEHLRGSDLAQLVAARGGLGIDEAVDYLLQACEALGEAHGRGIVHRDLKPQNLFLTQRPDGSPCLKILDFGISKAADDDAPNLTATDTVMGTPLYMSPEQVRSLKNVDRRSDIWALGSILFELLTASPIFEAPSSTALCAMIAMDPPTPLRARRPMAPAELEAVILRCLHKDPNGRFPDVASLAEALAPFASERGRLSATRVSRIVRAGASGSGQAAHAGSAPGPIFGSTTGATMDGSGRVSYVPPLGPSGYPQAQGGSFPPAGSRPPTTQGTWQQTGSPQRAGMSAVAVALLGVVTGIGVLAMLGGGVWFFWLRGARVADVAGVQADGGGTTAKAVAPSSAAASGMPSSTPAIPATPGMPATPGSKGKVDAKDAGAPSAPSALPSKPKEPDYSDLKRISEGRCANYKGMLARNDPKTNSQAKMVKNMVCMQSMSLSPNSGAANCDRVVCRQACSMLQDQECIRQLDYVEPRAPLKY